MLLKQWPFRWFGIGWLICSILFTGTTTASDDDSVDEVGTGDKGHGKAGFLLGYYYNDDDGNDGNPFLDEKLTVIEPVVIFDYNVTDKLTAWGKFSYDEVSSASIDRLDRFPEQSGASGDYYYGGEACVRYKWSDRTTVGGFLSASTEFDYDSYGFGGDIARDSADKNRTLKWSLNSFYDEIKIIRFDGRQNEGKDERITLTTSMNWYQVIDPKTHGEFGATLTGQWGFLETAYNSVIVGDPSQFPNIQDVQLIELDFGRTEELPGDRFRSAISGRVRRYYETKTALEIGTRLYVDSWGITSVSAEPSIHQWLVENILKCRFRYRFYTQTAANYFDDRFFTERTFRTQDADLGDFSSHGVGLQLNWFVSSYLVFELTGDFIFRSDGIDQVVTSIGVTREF